MKQQRYVKKIMSEYANPDDTSEVLSSISGKLYHCFLIECAEKMIISALIILLSKDTLLVLTIIFKL